MDCMFLFVVVAEHSTSTCVKKLKRNLHFGAYDIVGEWLIKVGMDLIDRAGRMGMMGLGLY